MIQCQGCTCAGWLWEGEGGLGDHQPGVYVPLKALFLVLIGGSNVAFKLILLSFSHSDETRLHEAASSLPIQNTDSKIQCPAKLDHEPTEILPWVPCPPVGPETNALSCHDTGSDQDVVG